MKPSITRRLLISNLVLLVGFLGLGGTALDQAFRASVESAVEKRLQAHVYTLLVAAQEGDGGRMRLPKMIAAPAFNQPDSGLYAEIIGEQGRYRWRSASLIGRRIQLVSPVAPGTTRFRITPQLALFDQGVVWEDDQGKPLRYTITVAMDSTGVFDEQRSFRATLWRWLGGLAALLLVAQVLLARWGLAPLREMSRGVQRIEAGEQDRIEGQVPGELEALSTNLNALIEQNRLRQERVRNSLADLAHSMKTPLAVLRGAAEQLEDDGNRALITEQTERINQIVSYQRQRAAVAGTSAVTRPLLLLAVITRLCGGLGKVHQDRQIDCDIRIPQHLQLRVDEGDIFELFGNLLENAFKHCRRQIRVSALQQGGSTEIAIEDDGDGIVPEDAGRLLQRGERADERHPGEGIGLAVVSEIVRQYRGDLKISSSSLGGAAIQIRIPTR